MAHTTHTSQAVSHSAPARLVVPGMVFAVWAATLILGQIGRFTVFGQSGGILPSDIANVMVIAYAILLHAFRRAGKTVKPAGKTLGVLPSIALSLDGERDGVRGIRVAPGVKEAGVTITPFLLWSLFVLMLHVSSLRGNDIFIALSYWVRLATILGLLPAFLVLFQYQNNKVLLKRLFLFLIGTLVVLGYLQILLYPSLQGIPGGWDPHNFRMVATWLDPNFFGAFLAMTLPYTIAAVGNSEKSNSGKRLGLTTKPQALRRIAMGTFISLAILLTQSRSTFVAMSVASTICGMLLLLRFQVPPVAKKLVPLGAIILVATVLLGASLLDERATNIFHHDPTVSTRIDAYKSVWRQLVEPNIFFGVGYNAYQFAAKDAGLISDFSLHSRAGSDSSILTLLVTTGIIGTALFLAPILVAFAFHVRKFLQKQTIYSLCFVWATIVLLIHSQFTNSLLYPHILMTYILLTVISFIYE